ncbi:rho guanine nucleotide exchange factor 28-like isoform X2 [Babylonia areolata]|uniref:rho guanine nucleotide exchange factor 28-like isoform X2 n=1 Tax=Babylonia areolata TaxID=304850 RepID=UPI003FD675BF
MPIQGGLQMAFRPTEAPVYGGDVLQVNLEEEDVEKEGALPVVGEEDELYLLLEGRRQVHVTTLRHSHDLVWLAPIPGHETAESVHLSVVRLSLEQDHADTIAVGEFGYHFDSAFFLAQFLINSVNNPSALDDLELIRSDNFDLANELLSTLDARLSGALRHIPFPEGWHLLGSEDDEGGEPDCRETLLHLAARLGLHKTALFLLTKAGSEEALCVMNRDGQLPCAVAAHNGFEDIAELFSGYNTNGMVTQLDEQLDTDFGIICNHGNAGVSLTTLPGATQNRSIETLIEALREMEATVKRGRSPGLRRQYQTDWPSPPLPHRQLATDHPYDTQEPSAETQVAETMERILREQRVHGDTIAHMMQGQYSYLNTGDTNATAAAEGQAGSQPTAATVSGLQISSEVVKEASRQYGILEGSLSSVRGINEGLLRLRGSQLLHRRHTDQQHVRRLGLSRFSTSCPSLDVESPHCPLSPIHEGDQHKSMLDLASEVGQASVASQSPTITLNDGFLAAAGAGADGDQTVRICVNGVTVDSSEDFPRQSSDDGSVTLRHNRAGCLTSPREEDVRRRSWCPDSPRNEGVRALDGDDALQTRALAMTGKSLSLSGLDCEEEESEDEALQPLSIPQFQQSPQRGDLVSMVPQHRASLDAADERALSGGSRSPEEDLSNSPVDSDGSGSAVKDIVDGPEEMRQINSEMMASSQVAHSMSDLTSSQMANGDKKNHGRSMVGMQGVRSYEDEGGRLGVAHATITKSLSTPSIPAATQGRLADDRKQRDIRREGKHAKFRRQDEIEEVEEDGTSGDRKEISLKDFLTEDPGDSDEKSKSGVLRKEEKKTRKPSVFTRFSYRNKKHKDKESKVKHSHHFVAVSFSNATACNVCHKPMANKPALRCENCLINVHEHSCKDQVALCDKYANMKVLQREWSASAIMGQDKQTAGSSLRPSNSFKLKDRSASAPVRRENSGSMAFVPHRHSVPSSGYVGSPPPGTTYLQWFQATSRFSVVDKAISETEETDGGSMGLDPAQSNISEIASESLESLDTVSVVVTAESAVLEEEPDLMLGVEEPEAWNITVERKTLKRMNAKDIKRQDTIWELIQTEKQYVKKLKIMQKLFRDPMLSEMDMAEDQIQRLFPRLDELCEVHSVFLRSLLALQTHSPDRSVEEIGPTLLDQFTGDKAERMKSVYGTFCSKHTEAIQIYKDNAKTDKKFQNFCRKMSNLSICEKRELPDFILGVTVRLAKYSILIEAIFKSTKDKKDREQLSQALQCSKTVVHGVDAQVAAYEKLMEVYRAFDSRTTVYMDKKFKRQDLIARGRHLVHAGTIGWKTARNRVLDTYALVLTDLLVFLQKNEQKYTFFLQDNKHCVVPLYKMLVREKRDERDSHGIYVISQIRQSPEMYELVCRTRDERDHWMRILQEAIKNCPEEDEVQPQQPEVVMEEERRKQEEKSRKMKDIINSLHQKDDVIKGLCEEKNRLMMELLEVSTAKEEGGSRSSSQYDAGSTVGSTTSVEVVQAAIEEASRLTTIIQGSGTHLSRSVSSAGEHVSASYVSMLMPKRAETFAGFDTPSDAPKGGALMKKRFNQQYGDEEGRCPSELSLHGTDTIPEDSVISTDSHYSCQPGLSPQSLPSTSSAAQGSSPQAWEAQSPGGGEGPGLDSSDHGSMGELSSSSVSSLVQPLAQPSSAEQMMSVVQLVKYLHNLMNLTAKQTTTVECLRAELAEAKEEISKLSQDMHGQRRTVYRHNQLEELRNLQENISRERQEWEQEKERERALIQQEKARMEAQRKMLEKQENELRSRKEDLRREKETLQRQIDMLSEQGLLGTSTLTDPGHLVYTVDLDTTDTHQHLHTTHHSPQGHRRSASADFFNAPPPQGEGGDMLSESQGLPRRPRHSVSSLHNYNNSAAAAQKPNVPMHLMSTRNEQRVGGANVQRLPMKLSSGGGQKAQAPAPPAPHSRTSSMSGLGARQGGSNPAHLTPTPQQAQGMIVRNQNTRSAPSNLAMVMKLAQPGKGRGGGAGGGAGHPPPQAPTTASAPSSKPAEEGDADHVIYF